MISNFVSQANKLKNMQMYLEHSIKSCGVSFDDDNSICDLRERLSADRFKECQDFRVAILDIAEPLNSLKLEVFNGKSLDLKQLKADFISIQERSRIAKTKAATKLRMLSEQEDVLSEEVFGLQQRMCEWSKNRNEMFKPQKVPVKTASMKEPAKEVQTFAKFVVKSGGHENGWRVKDHSMFLKLRSKYNERDKMIAAVRSIFPDMSERDVEEHEEWYLQYSKLQSEQNDAIKRWKEEQQNSQSEKEDVVVVSRKKTIVPLEDPRDVKERLLIWKEEKNRRQLEQQQLSNYLVERMQQMENNKKTKCEEAKLEIAKWKREKELRESRLAQQKLIEKQQKEDLRSMDGKSLIKQFQNQDDVFLRKRLALKKAKEAVGKATSCGRKVTSAVQRNPERLLQPTKQWLSRCSKSADVQNDRGKFWNVAQKNCKLGLPEWRKQIRNQ